MSELQFGHLIIEPLSFIFTLASFLQLGQIKLNSWFFTRSEINFCKSIYIHLLQGEYSIHKYDVSNLQNKGSEVRKILEITLFLFLVINLIATIINITHMYWSNGCPIHTGTSRHPDETYYNKEYDSPYILDENGELWVKYDTDNGAFIIERASPGQIEEYLHFENKYD